MRHVCSELSGLQRPSHSVLVLTSASSPTAKTVLTAEPRHSAHGNVLQKLKLQSVIGSPVATLLSI